MGQRDGIHRVRRARPTRLRRTARRALASAWPSGCARPRAQSASDIARLPTLCRSGSPPGPASRDVQTRRRQEAYGGAVELEPMLAAAAAWRRTALRAPLLEPRLAIAHDHLQDVARGGPYADLGLTPPGAYPRVAQPDPAQHVHSASTKMTSAGFARFGGHLVGVFCRPFVASRGRLRSLVSPGASLIRKRSQVRVLDRPLAGIQKIAAFTQFSRIWLLEDRHGRGVPWGHNGATGSYQ